MEKGKYAIHSRGKRNIGNLFPGGRTEQFDHAFARRSKGVEKEILLLLNELRLLNHLSSNLTLLFMKIATFLTAILALLTFSQFAMAGDLFIEGDFAAAREKARESGKLVMIDFAAEWCGPCRAVSPILDQIASEHADKIDVVKLNVDDNPETAMKYQVTSIPTMKIFRGGEVVKTVIGAKPKPALEADLAEFLS